MAAQHKRKGMTARLKRQLRAANRIVEDMLFHERACQEHEAGIKRNATAGHKWEKEFRDGHEEALQHHTKKLHQLNQSLPEQFRKAA